jgi:hypothetical protein
MTVYRTYWVVKKIMVTHPIGNMLNFHDYGQPSKDMLNFHDCLPNLFGNEKIYGHPSYRKYA